MKIGDIKGGDRKIDLTAEVTEKSEAREAKSKYTNETFRIASATIEDSTGHMVLNLWNEQIEMVRVGDTVKVENGYVKAFRDVLQLNSGKYGTLTVV